MTTTPHRCPDCGTETTYRAFSGGREWFCPRCEADGSYPDGGVPRRAAMLQTPEGAAALREEMRTHLATAAADGELDRRLRAALATPIGSRTVTLSVELTPEQADWWRETLDRLPEVPAEPAETIAQLRADLEQTQAQLRAELARQQAYEEQIVGQFNQQATNLTRRAETAEAQVAWVRAELDAADRMLGTDGPTFKTAYGARILANRIRTALDRSEPTP